MNEQNNSNSMQNVVNNLNNIPTIPPVTNNPMPHNNMPSEMPQLSNQTTPISVIPTPGNNGVLPANQINSSGTIKLGETPNMTYNGVINGENNQNKPLIPNKPTNGINLNTMPQVGNLPNASLSPMSESSSLNEPNNYNETSINDLNVDGVYNKMEKPEYINDPQVRENINPQKKNTLTITKELKTFIIISLVLLVFILIIPYIFDLISSIKY